MTLFVSTHGNLYFTLKMKMKLPINIVMIAEISIPSTRLITYALKSPRKMQRYIYPFSNSSQITPTYGMEAKISAKIKGIKYSEDTNTSNTEPSMRII